MRKVKDAGVDYDYYYEITSRTPEKTDLVARTRPGRIYSLIRYGLVVLLNKALTRKVWRKK